MDIKQQLQNYFPDSIDATADAGETVPGIYTANTVTPLVDGNSYFAELRSLMDCLGSGPSVKSQFLYIMGWELHFAEDEPVALAMRIGTALPSSIQEEPVDPGPAFALPPKQGSL